ncbi:MAG: hypothetical protein U1E36_07450 [Rickettsiales bacterium]
MRIRTFNALDISEAMRMVREEMGEEAVIISTGKNPMGKGVCVTVALDQDDLLPSDVDIPQEAPVPLKTVAPTREEMTELRNKSQLPDYLVRDVEKVLRYHGVVDHVMESILAKAWPQPQPKDDTDAGIRSVLTGALKEQFTYEPINVNAPGYRYILIGPPGAGKTVTTAKLAARAAKESKNIHVITTDNKRAGGVEQLSAFTDILGIGLAVAGNRADLKAILGEVPKEDRVLIDTAGANPYDFYELKELAEFAGLLELTPILIFPAGLDANESMEMAQAFSFMSVEKMIVTRTDLTRRYGSVLCSALAAGLSFSHATGSEKVLGNFEPVTPEYLSGLLMQYRANGGS